MTHGFGGFFLLLGAGWGCGCGAVCREDSHPGFILFLVSLQIEIKFK